MPSSTMAATTLHRAMPVRWWVCGRRELDRLRRGPTGEASGRLGRRRKHTRKRAEEGASGAFMPREGGEMGAPGASPRGEKEGALHHAEERKGGGPVSQRGRAARCGSVHRKETGEGVRGPTRGEGRTVGHMRNSDISELFKDFYI
jgi:hypothetical protein